MKRGIKKLITMGVICTLGISTMTACSSTSDNDSDGNVTLELFSTKVENKQSLQNIIDGFEAENPNIKINLTSPPDAETVLRTRLTKNKLPDILSMAGNSMYGELSRVGVLMDFTDSKIVDRVQPAYIDMINRLADESNKTLYGIPFATNANGVIYNVDKFKEAGLEIPKTWDELVAICETIKSNGEIPFYFGFKDSWTINVPWNAVAANIVDKNFTKNKNEGKITFKDSKYKEVAEKLLVLESFGHNDNLGTSYNDANIAFSQGKSYMYLQGNWAMSEILKSNPDMKLGMFPFPSTNKVEDNKLVSGVDVLLTGTADTKHKDEVNKFIEYASRPEVVQKYIDEQFAFSSFKDVAQKDEKVTNLLPSFESGNISSFVDHYYPQGFQADKLEQEFLNKKDVNQLLNNLDGEWDKILRISN
ncbi:MAG: ABC transporter substrate-binding protein [Peptostreptococcaceae bacterium]